MRRAPIRLLADLGTGHTPSRSHPEYWVDEDRTIPWLTLADVWQLRDGTRAVIEDTAEKITPLGVANSSAVVHPKGSVAFSRTASVGFACILGRSMATSQDFVTWTCGPHLDPRFLLWVLRGERNEIVGRVQGSTHKTIYMPDIRQLTTPVPDIQEQQRIAAFLDAETERIDQLVGLKRRMIALLEEATVADRAHVVLREHDPTDPSATHPTYPVARLSQLVRLQRGHDLPSDQRSPGNVPVVTSGGISGTHRYSMADGPGVVTGRYGTIGSVYYLEEPYWPHNTTLYVDDFRGSCPRWIFHLLHCLPFDAEADKTAVGGINRNIIGQLKVPVPPAYEQAREAAELDERIEARRRLAAAMGAQVELLVERRCSLIAAAVTGEMEVA